MKAALIKLVLKLLYGINSSHWEAVVVFIEQAADIIINTEDGAKRKAYVKEHLQKSFKGISSFALNALIELGLGYLVKEGVLNSKGVKP